MSRAGGSLEFLPISEENPLGRTGHFVGACTIPEPLVVGDIETSGFEAFYASLRVAVLVTVCDGDCAMDCMHLMRGRTSSFESRKALRIEISDYLISRMKERWMHELMAALQEVEKEDLAKAWGDDTLVLVKPFEPAPAVPEPAPQSAVAEDVAAPSEEAFAVVRWASRLQSDSSVLSLIRSLPKEVVEEQVQLYGKRAETAVAETATS